LGIKWNRLIITRNYDSKLSSNFYDYNINEDSENKNDSTNTLNYFYLIQCNEYYKIGKTHNYPLTRLKKAYGIGHKIYLVLQVKSDDFETLVMNKLINMGFTRVKQNGNEREWFSGDINKIKKCIIELYNETDL